MFYDRGLARRLRRLEKAPVIPVTPTSKLVWMVVYVEGKHTYKCVDKQRNEAEAIEKLIAFKAKKDRPGYFKVVCYDLDRRIQFMWKGRGIHESPPP